MSKANRAVLITLVGVLLLGAVAIYGMGDYGLTVFVLLPFLIGFLPAYLLSRREWVPVGRAYRLGFATLFLSYLSVFVLALEGMICLLMALPLALLASWLGAYVAYAMQDPAQRGPGAAAPLVLLATTLLCLSVDAVREAAPARPVTTTVVVDAPPATVWGQVVSFDSITAPRGWLFRTGVAYPVDARIEGRGAGAVRYCNFSTGSFVEPITVWDEPRQLAFAVREQPTPMSELNPFGAVHPPHLEHGYWVSERGQFLLTDLGDGRTKLAGTTWYRTDLRPERYWRWWSDFIVHRIHRRVLDHIAEKAVAL